jgi:uncharacterized membrane protein
MPANARHSVLKAILIGGIAAALLDILDPIIFFSLRGVAPIRIPQSIASGLLGRAAYSGGLRTALLGLILHLFIALVWATLFVLAARILPILTRHAVLAGLLYGAIIYVVMNYLVLPHSNVVPRSKPTSAALFNGIAAILLLVGLPISLANRYLAAPRRLSSY